MNYLILAGIALATYYLLRQRQQVPVTQEVFLLPTTAPTIEISTTTPVPISTEAGLGKTRYTFNIAARWANLDPISDIIMVQIGYNTLTTIQPRAATGSQLIPVTVDAVPGGSRRLAVVVKNIAGLEFDKAAAYADIAFGAWV